MAGYEGLTGPQQDRFDELMSQPVSQWPGELIGWVRAQGGSFCGDALADAVGRWVKAEVKRDG